MPSIMQMIQRPSTPQQRMAPMVRGPASNPGVRAANPMARQRTGNPGMQRSVASTRVGNLGMQRSVGNSAVQQRAGNPCGCSSPAPSTNPSNAGLKYPSGAQRNPARPGPAKNPGWPTYHYGTWSGSKKNPLVVGGVSSGYGWGGYPGYGGGYPGYGYPGYPGYGYGYPGYAMAYAPRRRRRRVATPFVGYPGYSGYPGYGGYSGYGGYGWPGYYGYGWGGSPVVTATVTPAAT